MSLGLEYATICYLSWWLCVWVCLCVCLCVCVCVCACVCSAHAQCMAPMWHLHFFIEAVLHNISKLLAWVHEFSMQIALTSQCLGGKRCPITLEKPFSASLHLPLYHNTFSVTEHLVSFSLVSLSQQPLLKGGPGPIFGPSQWVQIPPQALWSFGILNLSPHTCACPNV